MYLLYKFKNLFTNEKKNVCIGVIVTDSYKYRLTEETRYWDYFHQLKQSSYKNSML